MNSIRKWHSRLLAMALISFLVACGPAEEQAQPEEPAAEQTGDSQGVPVTEATEVPAMPEFLEVSGRFADMFITDITSDFNPGLQIGDQFPAIRAMFDGEEITSIDRFIRDKGAIFIAMRSADW